MNLPKVYEPKEYEADIYALWEKSRTFEPAGKGSGYSIVVPPPNANASMHIGTGMTVGIQDIVIRYQRLKGSKVLFLPGADHAGFETQVVYEKHLAKEGKSRFDFSREELYSQIWDFVAKNRTTFEQQYRKLGASVAWSRYTFTLDDKIVKQAYATFKQMWDEGLLYRGERLVNFCTFHGTAFADIEVVHKESKGKIWQIRYPLTDGSGEVVVATTRPETMLGDTGVAVHPDDKRYKKLIGKTVKLPITGREVPIIADEFVDINFGTGAVKLTPAHDVNDFEAAKRHNLPKITIIDHEGRINSEAPQQYRGLAVKEARERVIADLDAQGFLMGSNEHTNSVGHCYKCDTVIEPLLREQWFVDMQPLAKEAVKVLKAKKITFYPDSKQLQLIRYLENLRDWNISRQIAWGIPIPAFQNVDDGDDWIYDERVDQEIIKVNGKTYRRDPDVLDTWFSSSSWPYATLNYPDGADYNQYYPLSLLETGGEILYPWVSRMIMLGLYVTGQIPFKAVYIHGYVMAEDGSKMSKSLGNVIDPMEVIDSYGSDALRMGIIAGRVPAVNRGFDKRKVQDARNFCNKLWNVARYVEGKAGKGGKPQPKTDADHWILDRLSKAAKEIAGQLEEYRFAEAYECLYHFVWDDFADWYIEAIKAQENLPLLDFALQSILKIAHPFAPFITETIWQTLDNKSDDILVASRWPEIPVSDSKRAKIFEEIKSIIAESRAVIKATGVSKASLTYSDAPEIEANADLIRRLAKLEDVTAGTDPSGLKLIQTKYDLRLSISKQEAKAYNERLTERQKIEEATIKNLESRLKNKSYVSNAPEAVVNQTRDQLQEAKQRLVTISEERERFS